MFLLFIQQVQTNHLRPDGFKVLHDNEMHKALGKNYGDAIEDWRKQAAYWKTKYESWSTRIPNARI